MKTRLALLLALGVVAVLGIGYLARNDPEGGQAYFPQCLFHTTTGLHCPGCGSTRAAHALTKFDLGSAFRKNPLLVILLPFLTLGIVLEVTAWLMKERYRGPRVRLPGFWCWSLPVLIFSFWILRNVPIWPFELLAPR